MSNHFEWQDEFEDVLGSMSKNAGMEVVGGVGGIMAGINIAGTGGKFAVSLAGVNPVIAAVLVFGSIIAGSKSRRPFRVRNLGALKDRKDNTGKTVRKFLEAGFSQSDTIYSIFKDTVKTSQDYYEFLTCLLQGKSRLFLRGKVHRARYLD